MSEEALAALLPPGLHDKSLDELRALCVLPFPDSRTRPGIFAGLCEFVAELAGFGALVEVWVDGSFVTNKLNPNDVDIVALVDQKRFDALSAERQEALFNLFWHREANRAKRQVDAYVFSCGDLAQEAFWRDLYGHSRSGAGKGIVRLKVAS